MDSELSIWLLFKHSPCVRLVCLEGSVSKLETPLWETSFWATQQDITYQKVLTFRSTQTSAGNEGMNRFGIPLNWKPNRAWFKPGSFQLLHFIKGNHRGWFKSRSFQLLHFLKGNHRGWIKSRSFQLLHFLKGNHRG